MHFLWFYATSYNLDLRNCVKIDVVRQHKPHSEKKMNTVKDIKKGDIFYSEIGKRFYFIQIIHITTGLPAPYDNGQYDYGYFFVVFEKSFTTLPKTIEELDLNTIYRIKYKPTKSILYISHWSETPEIKVKMGRQNSEIYAKYKLAYFGNTEISNAFEPEIVQDFTMPAKCKINENGIIISHSPDGINWFYSRILQDQEKQFEKKKNIQAKYFKDWLEYVDAEAIIKSEKIITTFELEVETKDPKRALKKCVSSLNKLNDKLNFIMTIEAENLFEKLIEISVKFGLTENEAIDIIENNRDW